MVKCELSLDLVLSKLSFGLLLVTHLLSMKEVGGLQIVMQAHHIIAVIVADNCDLLDHIRDAIEYPKEITLQVVGMVQKKLL